MKKIFTIPNLVYFLFSIFYIAWVLMIYRNIIHMDMLDIVSTKVKHLFEHQLHSTDFVYEPIFPCFTSILFTLINAKFFHLNTVIEIAIGAVLLASAGYFYLNRMTPFIANKKHKILFAFMTGFLVFGLHKWEASFTGFFSFAVSFDLIICFFNYFFLVRYIDAAQRPARNYWLAWMIFSSLLVIFDATAYFYGYILAVLILLFLIRQYKPMAYDKRKWNIIFLANISLFLIALVLNVSLRNNPAVKQGILNPSMGDFISFLIKQPLWVIKFYLIAQSGPFLGEAGDHPGLSALAGLVVLIAYAIAIGYVLKKKDKRLFVMIAMIFYNIISCGLVTLGRYVFNVLEFGASSRYTVFNLSGVLGLTTILFFYIIDGKSKINKGIAWAFLTAVAVGYLYVDKKQLDIAPYRTANFLQMREALLTGTNLDILQDKPEVSLKAIEVLKKYRLNVYYDQKVTVKPTVSLSGQDYPKKIVLASGMPSFKALQKYGFYNDENGISWTNGKASVTLDSMVEVKDSLVVQLNTYMPPPCKNVNPEVSWFDTDGHDHLPVRTDRKGDTFYFVFYAAESVKLERIDISSETIDASPDTRKLSFPFVSLEIKKPSF